MKERQALLSKLIAIWLCFCPGAGAHSQPKGESTFDLMSPDPNILRLAIHAPLPSYPPEALQRHAHGDGYFVLRVDRFSGILNSVEILRSTGDRTLDAAALKALRQWRFKGGGVLPTKSDPRRAKESRIGVPVKFVWPSET